MPLRRLLKVCNALHIPDSCAPFGGACNRLGVEPKRKLCAAEGFEFTRLAEPDRRKTS